MKPAPRFQHREQPTVTGHFVMARPVRVQGAVRKVVTLALDPNALYRTKDGALHPFRQPTAQYFFEDLERIPEVV